jgi:hypothetical protein
MLRSLRIGFLLFVADSNSMSGASCENGNIKFEMRISKSLAQTCFAKHECKDQNYEIF